MFSTSVTAPRRGAGASRLVAAACALVSLLPAQTTRLDWRRIGNTAIDTSLASVATGPVDRVWYSEDGARLFAHTASGRIYETSDFETWALSAESVQAPAPVSAAARRSPERTAKFARV